jgi:copper chaperone CopZ
MKSLTIELPAMYGDHHVVEVRKLLGELPGVEVTYASSAFRVVELCYDPESQTEEKIRAVLEEAGYIGELPLPVETDIPATENNGASFFRHTQVYETMRSTVSFTQNVNYSGRPLWPCPGVGAVRTRQQVEE